MFVGHEFLFCEMSIKYFYPFFLLIPMGCFCTLDINPSTIGYIVNIFP